MFISQKVHAEVGVTHSTANGRIDSALSGGERSNYVVLSMRTKSFKFNSRERES